MLVNRKAKRVWFITDTHLGVRNSSNEWIEIMEEYFHKWFIPLVKKHYRPGDVLLHLGDVYDSRQSINIKVLNLGVKIFELFSEIFSDGIYIIAGNHDLWSKSSNDINSLKSLKWIPNVTIFEEPSSLELGATKFFMMPWRKDHQAEEETLDTANPHDFLCCHTDIRGLKFNKHVQIEEGAPIEKYAKFGKVYSGHIHYAQSQLNIKMLGSPYELTRSDMGNPKGITLLDLETGKEEYFVNNFSPKHKKIEFNYLLELTPQSAGEIFNNNFVDILIDPKIALKAPLNVITEIMVNARRISFHPYDSSQGNSISESIYVSDNKQFNVMDFIQEYVNGMEQDEATKEKLVNSIKKLYAIITTEDQENRI